MGDIRKLPYDMIHYILKLISIEDIVNLSWTCRYLHEAIWEPMNDELLRCKFFKRWPSLKEIRQRVRSFRVINIKREIIQRLKCSEELSRYFAKYRNGEQHSKPAFDMSDIDKFCCVSKCRCFKYYYVEDELMSILKEDTDRCNLTNVYCAKKVLFHIKHRRMMEKWQIFMNLPAEAQIPEKVATLVAQRCQSDRHVFYSHVSSLLDHLVHQVLNLLKEEHPAHPVHSASEDEFSLWKENNLQDHNWNVEETEEILKAIHNIMHSNFYADDNYRANQNQINNGNELISNFRSCMIDTVLKTKSGINICIAIIFQSVARRLGVRCDLMTSADGFFLCWRNSYVTPMFDFAYYYENHHFIIVNIYTSQYNINIIEESQMNDCSDLPDNFEDYDIYAYSQMNLTELLLHLTHPSVIKDNDITNLKYLQLEMLQIRHMADPKDKDTVMSLLLLCNAFHLISEIHYYIYIDLNYLWTMLVKSRDEIGIPLNKEDSYIDKEKKESRTSILETLSWIEDYIDFQYYLQHQKPKKRIKGLKYAIGMIVEIINKDTHFGVIIGWDIRFNEKMLRILSICSNIDTQQIFNVDEPYYIILISNNITYYISQDKITPTTDLMAINHDEIGRYFIYFEWTHYLPNETLNKIYVDDAIVRNQYIISNYI